MRAVDLSNFSGVPTIAQAMSLRDVARKAIIGCQDLVIATQQVDVCYARCLEIDLYAQPSINSRLTDVLQRVDAVVKAAGLDRGRRTLWLAFDMTPPSDMSPDFFIGWMSRFVSLARLLDFNVGIYTRRNLWVDFMGDNSEFSSYPLWYADYDGLEVIGNYGGFGGWLIPTMKQYAQNVSIDGITVDLNVY